MKVELNWNGEDLDITLGKEEALDLKSYLGYFSRNRIENVSNGEYEVAQKLYKEISLYIDEY